VEAIGSRVRAILSDLHALFPSRHLGRVLGALKVTLAIGLGIVGSDTGDAYMRQLASGCAIEFV